MDVLSETRARNADLAAHLARVMAAPLPPLLQGPWPLRLHLWKLEFFADVADWIDEGYRCRLAAGLLAHWRARLSETPPGSWRLILYEDLAPSIAILPLAGDPGDLGQGAISVTDPGDVMRAYLGRRWQMLGSPTIALPDPDHILAQIAAHRGSLGRDTTQALGVKPGHLRFLIEQEGLVDQVNAIRTGFGQPAEAFRQGGGTTVMPFLLYEERITIGP